MLNFRMFRLKKGYQIFELLQIISNLWLMCYGAILVKNENGKSVCMRSDTHIIPSVKIAYIWEIFLN